MIKFWKKKEVVKEPTPLEKAWKQLAEGARGYVITVEIDEYTVRVSPSDIAPAIAVTSRLKESGKHWSQQWTSIYRYVREKNVEEYCFFVEHYEDILGAVKRKSDSIIEEERLKAEQRKECRAQLEAKIERCNTALDKKVEL